MNQPAQWSALAIALASLSAMAGCKASAAEASLSKEAANDEGPPPKVPVPAADGPKLVVLRDGTPVVDRPSASGKVIGELRTGGIVARSAEPYSNAGCKGGWYAVRPRGFVCAGDAASLDEAARHAVPPGPDLGRALPYRYGRARTEGVELYARVPSPADQAAAEPDLDRHLARLAPDEPLGAAANDVPLDARGVPTGPPVILPAGEGVDPSGKRTAASFFDFGATSAPLPLPGQAAPTRSPPLRKGSGVAIAASFTAEGGAGERRFGLTPDGRFVPTDRLRAALGTTFHGIDLDKIGLPIAFVHKRGVHTWELRRGKAEKEDNELERRTPVPLSGKFRTVEGVRYDQTKEGSWVRAQDVIMVVRRHKFPDFVTGTQKWLDVSLANQTLTAYEGKKPVYATLISSGHEPSATEPAAQGPALRGTFRVKRKAVTVPVDPREVGGAYDVADAPWAIELDRGYAITGNYWSDPMGEAQGYRNVALSPIDARRIWGWADPRLPEGWHAVADDGGETTIVFVRP